jgi:hypothetical protein
MEMPPGEQHDEQRNPPGFRRLEEQREPGDEMLEPRDERIAARNVDEMRAGERPIVPV